MLHDTPLLLTPWTYIQHDSSGPVDDLFYIWLPDHLLPVFAWSTVFYKAGGTLMQQCLCVAVFANLISKKFAMCCWHARCCFFLLSSQHTGFTSLFWTPVPAVSHSKVCPLSLNCYTEDSTAPRGKSINSIHTHQFIISAIQPGKMVMSSGLLQAGLGKAWSLKDIYKTWIKMPQCLFQPLLLWFWSFCLYLSLVRPELYRHTVLKHWAAHLKGSHITE